MGIDLLAETIDDLAGSDPVAYADGESIEALHRELRRLEAFVTTATAAFDASGDWADDGARNASAWLATRCRMPRAEARRTVRRGRVLRHLPAFARAWSDGEIGAAHVDAVAAVRREATEVALQRDEDLLATQAATLRFDTFTRALAYWEQLADPDGAEEEEMARRDRRDAYLARSLNGMWLGRITLDPFSGSIVSGELERLERRLFEEDWARARDELGREPTSGELARTPGQRRADALVEMAVRSRTAPADGRRPQPLFTVLVGYETLHGRICELEGGGVVTPGSLVPWLDGSVFERAVFGPGGRVEVSQSSRLFTGATRRAIEIRDRECTHPYCDGSSRDLEVDHVVPFAAGGPTSQENGRILCGFHNRLRNQRPPPPAA